MNDKDREAFETWFNANCLDLPTDRKTKIECIADRQALHHNWQRAWQAALATRPDVNQELVEALEDIENKLANMRKERACSWAYYVSCIDKIIQKALAALHDTGIGRKPANREFTLKHPSNQG